MRNPSFTMLVLGFLAFTTPIPTEAMAEDYWVILVSKPKGPSSIPNGGSASYTVDYIVVNFLGSETKSNFDVYDEDGGCRLRDDHLTQDPLAVPVFQLPDGSVVNVPFLAQATFTLYCDGGEVSGRRVVDLTGEGGADPEGSGEGTAEIYAKIGGVRGPDKNVSCK